MDSDKSPHNQKKGNHHKLRTGFTRQIATKETRKLRARQEKKTSLWLGLRLLGLVGWSIVVPTLLGLALGAWIDGRFPSRFSWTIMLLMAGLLLGCLNAWMWVDQEQSAIARPHNQTPSESASPKESNHD